MNYKHLANRFVNPPSDPSYNQKNIFDGLTRENLIGQSKDDPKTLAKDCPSDSDMSEQRPAVVDVVDVVEWLEMLGY